MGICIEKLPHYTKTCNSSDALQVFENEDGTHSGFCFSCHSYVKDPYGNNPPNKVERKGKTPEQIQEEMEEISSYPIVDVQQKRLRAATLEKFGVRVGVSEEDGKTPTVLCYPYYINKKLVAYKIKLLPVKRMWCIGVMKDVDPFGWERATGLGARRLIVTEGEDDAMAWDRILELHSKEEYKDNVAVISLSNGAGSAKNFFSKRLKDIKKHFNEVYLSFDMDEVGRKAVEEVSGIFPEAKDITLPEKDANECIIKGKAKAAFSSLFRAAKPKNSRLSFADDLHEAAKEQASYGELSWPWEHINKDTRGIRYGETIYIGGPVKAGKSEVVNALAAHFIKVHGIKVFLAKLEEIPKHSYKLLAGKVAERIFHDPDIPFDEEAYNAAGEVLQEKVVFVDAYQHVGWATLKNDILEAISLGYKAFFIDPITNLTGGMNSADANTELESISEDLSVIAKDHNVVVFIFCHLKAHDGSISKEQRHKYYHNNKFIGLGNCPHELGGDVHSNQFAGSRAMMRRCHQMIGLECNKDTELPEDTRNIRHLTMLADRTYGVTGRYPLFWSSQNGMFSELPTSSP